MTCSCWKFYNCFAGNFEFLFLLQKFLSSRDCDDYDDADDDDDDGCDNDGYDYSARGD